MIKKIFFILIFSLLVLFYGTVNTYFCDGFIEGNICEPSSIIDEIEGLESFNSNYTYIKTGYFGSKNFSNNNDELETNIGYFGNKYNFVFGEEKWSSIGFLGNKRTVLSPNYQIPVGLFGLYKNQTLIFTELENENIFLYYPLVKYNKYDKVITSGGGNSFETCSGPKNITNARIEVKNNGIFDYIHISWDNPGKEKVKIVKISPQDKVILIDQGLNYLDDYDIKVGYYSYFIAVYNDCNKSGLYSDLLKINYSGEEKISNLYLSLSKYELTLHIPNTIELENIAKIKIECKNNSGNLINSYLVNNKYYLDNNIINKYFTCEASFFDSKGVYQKSELFVNNPLKESYIKEKQALDYIYVGDSSNYLFNSLYLNVSKYNGGVYLTYGKSSLYLINTLAKIYVSNEDLSFDALKSLLYLGVNVSPQDKITEQDFIKLLLFIERDIVKFQKNIYKYVNDNYGNKKYNLVLNDINQNISFIKKLKEFEKTDTQKYNNLVECISKVSCKDTGLLEVVNIENLKQEIDLNTYKDYMKILYYNLGNASFKEKSYKVDDYNKFLDIIIESVSYGNIFYDNKISYESFRNLQYEILLHEKLQDNISYLIEKHLEKIIAIYDSSKKEEMIFVLRDFLQ